MALDAGAETFLVCGIGGKKLVKDGVFGQHAPTLVKYPSKEINKELLAGHDEQGVTLF
jgi:hypothetical protein